VATKNEYVCAYCGLKKTSPAGWGAPYAASCPKREGKKPHDWTLNRKLTDWDRIEENIMGFVVILLFLILGAGAAFFAWEIIDYVVNNFSLNFDDNFINNLIEDFSVITDTAILCGLMLCLAFICNLFKPKSSNKLYLCAFCGHKKDKSLEHDSCPGRKDNQPHKWKPYEKPPEKFSITLTEFVLFSGLFLSSEYIIKQVYQTSQELSGTEMGYVFDSVVFAFIWFGKGIIVVVLVVIVVIWAIISAIWELIKGNKDADEK